MHPAVQSLAKASSSSASLLWIKMVQSQYFSVGRFIFLVTLHSNLSKQEKSLTPQWTKPLKIPTVWRVKKVTHCEKIKFENEAEELRPR